MSYILNALRKSEQERQATQPETITEQVLMSQPKKSRKTAALIGGLLAVNLLAVALLIWYLKKADEAPAKPHPAQQVQKKKAPRPLPAVEKAVDHVTDPEQGAASNPAVIGPTVQKPMRPQFRVPATPVTKAPSIEDLAAVKQAEEEKPVKPALENREAPSDRESQRASPHPFAGISGREQFRQEFQASRAQRLLAAKNDSNPEEENDEAPEIKTDAAPTAKQEIPLFKDLPYDFRSSAPKMTINVFVYDEKPEDRFVVMNMTKYKTGQTTKESVEIKEIRPDSLVASFGGRIFRIERP